MRGCVDHAVVDDLERVVDVQRRQDDTLGGGAVYEVVTAYLRLTVDVIRRCSPSEAVGARLYAVAAEQARLAGWSAFDAGNPGLAQRLWLAALRASHEAGDKTLSPSLEPNPVSPAAVAARMRRQEALYDPTKRFTFVLTEAGLRWPAGNESMMAAQYDRIMQISTLSNVEIGVIPLGQPVSALPWCDLNLYDDLADGEPPVIDIELPHAEVWITNSTDVAVYVGLVRRLWESSLTGDAARTLLAGLSNQSGRT